MNGAETGYHCGSLLLTGRPICGKIGRISLAPLRTELNKHGAKPVIRLRTCHLPLTFHRRAMLLMIARWRCCPKLLVSAGKRGEELITHPRRRGHTVSRARNNEICRWRDEWWLMSRAHRCESPDRDLCACVYVCIIPTARCTAKCTAEGITSGKDGSKYNRTSRMKDCIRDLVYSFLGQFEIDFSSIEQSGRARPAYT